MKANTNHLMGAAEAIAFVTGTGLCIALAVSGHPIAWLFGFGTLTFAWDLWRRFRNVKTDSAPKGHRES
ncbi:hypothetical protein [Streptomyces sp. KL2]|uniref:hypothetical protein n=1 Tax=Streptomyces sp. KL2 TaxID=3050126 RepID=UPI0039783528